ncbi:snare-associated protein snapin-like [Plakobranchus ocellatus]|uniref:Biogenesis of lysosome-related organelles complex 1 subunit 7 n=1 Tax=Plakobranchus ocellatus TaxID=259542 RepID=A0AAV4BLK4_9GAST|nr:snare-associated protein snapin-like [Plakobranchus ocellatus]
MSLQGDKPLDTENKDAIARGLVGLLKPAVEEIDERVKGVRESQVELRQQIDSLCEDLKKISENDPMPVELEPYVKKLNSSRRRVMLVNSILQNVQDRLNKLHHNISKETARRKTMLDPSSPSRLK